MGLWLHGQKSHFSQLAQTESQNILNQDPEFLMILGHSLGNIQAWLKKKKNKKIGSLVPKELKDDVVPH